MKESFKLFLKRRGFFWKIYMKFFYKFSYTELAIKEIFDSKQINSFVQVGSNDGISGDPFFKFIKSKPIPSVFIEAIPSLFEELKKNYGFNENYNFVNCFVSNDEEKKEIFYFEQVIENNYPKWILQLGSFNPNHGNDLFEKYPKLKKSSQKVESKSLKKIFEQFFKPHFLHIDTEGYDYEILKSIDFNFHKPKYIMYEFVHLNNEDLLFSQELLKKQGYQLQKFETDILASLTK
ncbi:MAG: FkbM family methyltransferase [Chitinophagales bacterium]|jgi:FkbM family methyltransferase|nr:FkbM family methyltransferase [Chitinophagales bacterium]